MLSNKMLDVYMYLKFDDVANIDEAINESTNNECPICLDNISNKYTILKCNHVFHNSCIKAWLKTHNDCPTCRTYLKEYYNGNVINKSKLKYGVKFILILNDDKFIIKYYYKYTNLLKKRVEILITKIKYFSHAGKFFTYHFLDKDTHTMKQETLYIHNNGAEHLFSKLKIKINNLMRKNGNFENIIDL
tara:strand:+ start:167 stop:733 length:567 start_codon:yes stop_codon:yes gene_type:complete